MELNKTTLAILVTGIATCIVGGVVSKEWGVVTGMPITVAGGWLLGWLKDQPQAAKAPSLRDETGDK